MGEEELPATLPETEIGAGSAAIAHAASTKKYLFVFFHKEKDALTATMRERFDDTVLRVQDRAEAIAIDIGDAAEADIVAKFKVSRAPMPLVLVLAPNGAIMKGLSVTFTEEQLLAAFVSLCQEKNLKALQARSCRRTARTLCRLRVCRRYSLREPSASSQIKH